MSDSAKPDRWMVLTRTSPSGKTLFQCRVCMRISIAPDKTCPPFRDGATNPLTCQELWDPTKVFDDVLQSTCTQVRDFSPADRKRFVVALIEQLMLEEHPWIYAAVSTVCEPNPSTLPR